MRTGGGGKHPANMKELAAALGLSRATVSYVLNGRWRRNGISAATARRVKDYVRETAFVPSTHALTLKGKVRKDVAVLLPPSLYERNQDPFFQLLAGLGERGLSYVIVPFFRGRHGEALQTLKTFRVRHVVGMGNQIFFGDPLLWPKLFANMPEARWYFFDFPFEQIDVAGFVTPRTFCAGFDRDESLRVAVRHIVRCGYRRLVLRENMAGSEPMLRATCRGLGRRLDFCFVETPPPGDPAFERGQRFAERVLDLDLPRGDTAVLINNDRFAGGVVQGLLDRGKRVPDDLGVIGTAGVAESAYYPIPLTTITVPHARMLAALMGWLGGKGRGKQVVKLRPAVREGGTIRRLM
ncbi:MAG: LacI family DNA-binding transcriptional regulator [Kiritimatiellae bacterium]|nr:LacI family DNA-binding transcriptional regulator [Kiritimatiellia bacterium]